jgi:hypothetical protein
LQRVFPLLKNTLSGLDGSESEADDIDSSSASTLTVQYPEIDENGALLDSAQMSSSSSTLDWSSCVEKHSLNPLSCSFGGSLYGSFGCFPIGLNATQEDFRHVLQSQQRLRGLSLLSKVSSAQLHAAADVLNRYCVSASKILDSVPSSRETIADLSNALANTNDDADESYQLRVYIGLDSGFHIPTGDQFWSVWELDSRTTSPIIYVSKSVQDLPSVLLHTYLSRSHFPRYQCFLVEYGFAEVMAAPKTLDQLPQRIEQDLNLLSSTDVLLYLQHLQQCEWDKGCALLSAIYARCEELLLDIPTYRQLKKLCNMDYISGSVTDEQLVVARIKWYRLCQLPCLNKYEALELFRQIEVEFQRLLWQRDHENLDMVTSALEKLTKKNKLDSVTDFVLFCIFCAARKAGFEEVYIEVSDRNPLFNQYSDQSAAFAELFALGSRCEAYFDILPSDIGVLLSKKHRNYYNQSEHQPPMWVFNAPSFASAYAAAQTDIDPDQKRSVIPGYRRFTFLSVFAIPALVGNICPLLYTYIEANQYRYHASHDYWSRPVCECFYGSQ